MTKVTDAYFQARRQEILDAAFRVFQVRGIEAATMQEIAAEAGISTGATYRYFRSKEELIGAVCGGAIEEARAMFDGAGASASPFDVLISAGKEAAQRLTDPAFAVVEMEMQVTAARMESSVRDQFRELHHEVAALIRGVMKAAQERGEIAHDLDLEGLTDLADALVSGLQVLAIQRGERPDTNKAIDVMARLLRTAPPMPRADAPGE